MKKSILSIILIFSFTFSFAQIVETVLTHPKIVDGLYVDIAGNVFTTPGGLVNGTQIGKYDMETETYEVKFAIGFAGPINIAVYQDSLFIVTNYDNNTVYSHNLITHQNTTLASGLDGPAGIVIDTADNIYISNWGEWPPGNGHQIHKISPTGTVSVYVDSSALYRPQAICINHLNEIIVNSEHNLYKINPVDSSLVFWVDMGYDLGNMTFRKKDSCIYGASISGNKIIKINSLGDVSVFSGSTAGYQDGDISVAKFNKPLGIAFSHTEDTLYVSEGGNVNRLRRIIFNETVGLNELKDGELIIYPNPSSAVSYTHLTLPTIYSV